MTSITINESADDALSVAPPANVAATAKFIALPEKYLTGTPNAGHPTALLVVCGEQNDLNALCDAAYAAAFAASDLKACSFISSQY